MLLVVVQEGLREISKRQFLQKQFSLRQHLGLEAFGKWDFNAGCGEEKRTLIENGDAQIAQMHKCTLACINLTEPLNGRPWLMKISIGGKTHYDSFWWSSRFFWICSFLG